MACTGKALGRPMMALRAFNVGRTLCWGSPTFRPPSRSRCLASLQAAGALPSSPFPHAMGALVPSPASQVLSPVDIRCLLHSEPAQMASSEVDLIISEATVPLDIVL